MYVPCRVGISNITQANPCVITTMSPHNMTTGQIVRVHVPINYGMVELNQKLFSITVIGANSLSLQVSQIPPAIPVNSTSFTPFVTPANPGATAEILAVGSGPTPLTATPWQANNNFCDSLLGDATSNQDKVEIPF